MSRCAAAAGAIAILAVAGLAQAQVGPPSPAGLVRARQVTLDLSAIANGSMRDAMKTGREAKTQAYAAMTLAKWARILPTLFPTGTGQGETDVKTQALPAVWRDRAGFEKAAAGYAAAADRLADLAKANDTEGFKAQLDELSHACDVCHATYKEGDRGPK
jgi:cytochrome c556